MRSETATTRFVRKKPLGLVELWFALLLVVVRVIDELPDGVVLYAFTDGSLDFRALPPARGWPLDEQSASFLEAFAIGLSDRCLLLGTTIEAGRGCRRVP